MKIIFHHPSTLGSNTSGSAIRPSEIYRAMLKNGIEVFEITGSRHHRKEKFDDLKKKIGSGEKFDFFYSEGLTLPINLRLIEPISGVKIYVKERLDMKILKFFVKNRIAGGYFVRDIYWDFSDQTIIHHNRLKQKYISKMQAHYGKKEMLFLRKLGIHIFCPTKMFGAYLEKNYDLKSTPLHPGSAFLDSRVREINDNMLNVFYVGGVTGGYDAQVFIEGLVKSKSAKFTLCTRKRDWEDSHLVSFTDHIELVHLSGDDLLESYKMMDLAILPQPPLEYAKMAFSLKVAEYIGQGLPIIAFKGTTMAHIIEENNIGWTIEYNVDAVVEILDHIFRNRDEYSIRQQNVLDIQQSFTWEAVVNRIVQQLQ